jgi:hypothetical protein
MTHNYLQNTTQKIKDRVTRTNPTKIVNYYLLDTLHMVRHHDITEISYKVIKLISDLQEVSRFFLQ